MIVVIDDDSGRRDLAETILARLRFAVAPFASVEQVVSTMRALIPVAREHAANEALRRLL